MEHDVKRDAFTSSTTHIAFFFFTREESVKFFFLTVMRKLVRMRLAAYFFYTELTD